MQLIPLILDGEGGLGREPASRAPNSKRLIGATYEFSLLEKCILRGKMLYGVQQLISVMSRDFFYIHKEELNALNQNMSFILESFRRNSAAVVAAAALHVAQFYNEDTLILVMPLNHLNVAQDVFQQTISIATELALSGNLVTFGRPFYETNKKYSPPREYHIKSEWVQKPYFKMGTDTWDTNRFLWNSNLFLFKAGIILQAIKDHCPDVLSALLNCLQYSKHIEKNSSLLIDLNSILFFSVPEYSINEAVIKKSSKTVVLESGLEWLAPNMLEENF